MWFLNNIKIKLFSGSQLFLRYGHYHFMLRVTESRKTQRVTKINKPIHTDSHLKIMTIMTTNHTEAELPHRVTTRDTESKSYTHRCDSMLLFSWLGATRYEYFL